MTSRKQMSVRDCIAIGLAVGAAVPLYDMTSPSIGVLPALALVAAVGAVIGLVVNGIGALIDRQRNRGLQA
jgi:hypothetical protein